MIDDLLEALQNYFESKPKRLVLLGACTRNIALLWLAAGLYAQAGILAVSIVSPAARGSKDPQVAIEQLVPGMPTWWVPEHPVSFALLMASVALGIWMLHAGKKLDRFMDRYV
ncbi:hypothetical protein N0K08_15870 [Acidovorax sp. Be4]|uniref:Uncharacterized protein n=1 Tax=Acidovorax bellezanensis TaxID=2976702 RepID=A0ABT2PSN6_9BURK|nr:hypothetical protein [Acidovorax sp. Be4]MCT9812123.1 hypothetical protein [Acidovorax sp. Be4]